MRWLEWMLVASLAGAPLGCGPADVGPDAPDAVTRKVMLTNTGDKPIEVIKALRAATGLGLAEAKALVDSIPSVVATGLSHEEADRIARMLLEAGATTQITRD